MRLSVPVQVALGLVLVAVIIALDATIWPDAMRTATVLFLAAQLLRSWRRGDRKVVWQMLLLVLFAVALFMGADYIETSRGG